MFGKATVALALFKGYTECKVEVWCLTAAVLALQPLVSSWSAVTFF